jgi:hypothetical protein
MLCRFNRTAFSLRPCLSSEHFHVAQHRFAELSKDCLFVPVLNHVLTIGQDLLSIKTKKIKNWMMNLYCCSFSSSVRDKGVNPIQAPHKNSRATHFKLHFNMDR